MVRLQQNSYADFQSVSSALTPKGDVVTNTQSGAFAAYSIQGDVSVEMIDLGAKPSTFDSDYPRAVVIGNRPIFT